MCFRQCILGVQKREMFSKGLMKSGVESRLFSSPTSHVLHISHQDSVSLLYNIFQIHLSFLFPQPPLQLTDLSP